jgi:RNA polymerase sigma factor (sigma-70 family)
MATAPVGVVLHHLRKLASAHTLAGMPDHVLLERFLAGREEAAFEALVARHGPMVYHVCRRVLTADHDAEDAFQATFLALARQARTIRKRTSLAAWLHGVAHRIAGKARTSAQRRTARERRLPERQQVTLLDDVTWRELRTLLDEELARLPQAYRAPLVLCYLEERTQDEAARQLGWSRNTFRRRLERGRELLRHRLGRRGVTLSAGLFATLLAGQGSKSVAAPLTAAVVKAALAVAAGEPAAVSASVAALAEGAFGGFKLKLVAALLLATAVLAAGAGVAYEPGTETQATKKDDPPAVESRKPKTDAQGDPLPAGAIARLGTARLRHGFALFHAILSPDGKYIASAGYGRGVCLWDAATGKELRVLLSRWQGVGHVDFSPDGKLLAGGDGPVYVWDVATGKELHRVKLEKEKSERVHVTFSPDGKLLAAADGKLVHLWDLATGQEKRRLEGPDGWIGSLAFAPDSKVLATTHEDMNLRLWDIAQGTELHRLLSPPPEMMARYPSVAFSPDGKFLAAAAFGKRIQLFDPKTGKEVRSWECDAPGGVGLAFAPDGKALVSGGGDGILRFWDPATGKELRRWETHGPALNSLAFSKDGTRLVTTAFWQSRPRLWDVASGKELLKFTGHDAGVDALAITTDGKALLSAGRDKAVLRWDLAASTETQRFAVPSAGFIQLLAFAANGKSAVSFSWNDGAVRVWDVASGKEARLLDKLGKQQGQFLPSSLAMSPDGRLAAAVEEGKAVRVWEVVSGKQLQRIGGAAGRANSITFSPNGKRLAAASGGPNSRVAIWEIERGFMVWTKSTGSVNGPMGVVFAPDGKRLVTFGWDGQIRLWDIAAAKEVRSFSGERAGLGHGFYHVAFSPDGRLLSASGGEDDKMVHIWEVNTGLEVRRFQGHVTGILPIAFAPDGRSLASGGADSMIYLWDITGHLKDGRVQSFDLSERDLEERWESLASSDGPRAVQAIWDLAFSPRQAVPFLQKKLKRPEAPEDNRLKQLLADLDSDQFDRRSAAMKELERLGEQAGTALRQALASDPSPEMRKRLEQLLAKLEPEKSPQRLRELRAVQALEYAGTPEARQLLEKLAARAADAHLTREAKAALERVARK